MSAVSRSPLPPSPDFSMQEVMELERNPCVSCLYHLFSVYVDDLQTPDSGSGLFASAQNVLITGGTFVSSFRGLYESSMNICYFH